MRNVPASFYLSASWRISRCTYFCDRHYIPTHVDQIKRSHRTTRLSGPGGEGVLIARERYALQKGRRAARSRPAPAPRQHETSKTALVRQRPSSIKYHPWLCASRSCEVRPRQVPSAPKRGFLREALVHQRQGACNVLLQPSGFILARCILSACEASVAHEVPASGKGKGKGKGKELTCFNCAARL